MKHSTKINLMALLWLACASHFLAAPSKAEPVREMVAAPKAALITRDNFISLWWSQDGQLYTLADPAPFHASFRVTGNVIRCEFGNDDKMELTANLSNKQMDELAAKLSQRQPNPHEAEKPPEDPEWLFSLFYSDENNEDQDDEFVLFGDTAQPNVELTNYLGKLVQLKFSQLSAVPPAAAPKSMN